MKLYNYYVLINKKGGWVVNQQDPELGSSKLIKECKTQQEGIDFVREQMDRKESKAQHKDGTFFDIGTGPLAPDPKQSKG